MKEERITILVVEPKKKPCVKIIANTLKALQHTVDTDLIEAIHPFEDTSVALICDEEGKIKRKEYNRALRDKDGHIIDVVAGTFFLARREGEEFASLTQEQIDTYTKFFSVPEAFLSMGGKLIVVPMED